MMHLNRMVHQLKRVIALTNLVLPRPGEIETCIRDTVSEHARRSDGRDTYSNEKKEGSAFGDDFLAPKIGSGDVLDLEGDDDGPVTKQGPDLSLDEGVFEGGS